MLFIHSSTKDSLCNENLILYTHRNEYITRRDTNYMGYHSTRVPVLFKTQTTRIQTYVSCQIQLKSSLRHTPNAQQQGRRIDVSTCWVTTPSQNAVSLDDHSTSLQVRCTTETSKWATVPLLTASAWLRLATHCTCEPALYEWHAGGPCIMAEISCMEYSSRRLLP